MADRRDKSPQTPRSEHPDVVFAMREAQMPEGVRTYARNLHLQIGAIYRAVGVTTSAELAELPSATLRAHRAELAKLPELLLRLREALGSPDVAEHRLAVEADAAWHATSAERLQAKAEEMQDLWKEFGVEVEDAVGDLQMQRLVNPEIDPEFFSAEERLDALYAQSEKLPNFLDQAPCFRLIQCALSIGDFSWAHRRAKEGGYEDSIGAYMVPLALASARHGEFELPLGTIAVVLGNDGTDPARKASTFNDVGFALYVAAAKAGREDIIARVDAVAVSPDQREVVRSAALNELRTEQDFAAAEMLGGRDAVRLSRYLAGEDTLEDDRLLLVQELARASDTSSRGIIGACNILPHLRRDPALFIEKYQAIAQHFLETDYKEAAVRIQVAIAVAKAAQTTGMDPSPYLAILEEEAEDLTRSEYDDILPAYADVLAECAQDDAAYALVQNTKDETVRLTVRYRIAQVLLRRGDPVGAGALMATAVESLATVRPNGLNGVERELFPDILVTMIGTGRNDVVQRALAMMPDEDLVESADTLVPQLVAQSMSVGTLLEALAEKARAEQENAQDARDTWQSRDTWRQCLLLSTSAAEGDDFVKMLNRPETRDVKKIDVVRWLWEGALAAKRRAIVLAKANTL